MGEKRDDSKPGRTQVDIIWMASVVVLGLVGVISLLHPSKNPALVLYSTPTLLLHLLFLGTLGLGVFAWRKRSRAAQLATLVAMLGVSAALGARGALFELPGLMPLVLVGRTLAFVAFVGVGLLARREGRRLIPQASLVLGATLAIWTVLDWGLYAWTVVDPPQRFHPLQGTMPGHRADISFREPFDPDDVRETDVILIGDSFVWGIGVEADETMGKRLDALFPDQRVISLGSPGQNVAHHVEVLSTIPVGKRAERIVLVYYHNDMPKDNSLISALDDADKLARTSPGAILAFHFIGKVQHGDLEDYHNRMVADADPKSPDFARRWGQLSAQLKEFAQLVRERSDQQPVLVILPIMVDFKDYPLADAHARIGNEGETHGYEVVDMLPVFRDKLGDGVEYRASPNDNHCNAEAHQLIADTLYAKLHGSE